VGLGGWDIRYQLGLCGRCLLRGMTYDRTVALGQIGLQVRVLAGPWLTGFERLRRLPTGRWKDRRATDIPRKSERANCGDRVGRGVLGGG